MNIASRVWALPKTDLHLHLDTSLRPSTALELCRDRGVKLETEEDLTVPEDCGSLLNYLKYIDPAIDILQDKESLERCASELAEDLINDNVVYAEIRFAPELHTRKGLTEREVLTAVWNGFRKGQYKSVRIRLIVCALRHFTVEGAWKALETALAGQHLGVIAFDLAGDENALPAENLKDVFTQARKEGLKTICHAGEARGPESIYEALDLLGAIRIGHGVRAPEDPALMKRLAKEQIPLETCPTSNIVTQAVSSWESHPAGLFLREGLRVTVNTDARTTIRTTVTDELVRLSKAQGLTEAQLIQMILNGFESGFDVGPEKTKYTSYLRSIIANTSSRR